ncbi:hypothetical protein VIBNISOn1_p0226 [Vibrio nigripulchritudo SOn1]|uniref:Uncharacterized protein n=1 Tax=Vibrio nigripulchritudo SOn1 TaxID=1238450 RepID=A0AAV2W1E6_9VIBR|nr:hypothetical protein [Vibrio nigripulchritudo]CCO50388.1 hypothetical protein VIBNISOn1_p0226 [Vibrio nigripulchritudo SOn1]
MSKPIRRRDETRADIGETGGKAFGLLLGNRVLQGGQHRVTETIRETMGVAYSPYVDLSLSNWYKGYGYINIHSNTAAKHVEGIKKSIRISGNLYKILPSMKKNLNRLGRQY